jgi:beta propeller repeat protein
VSEPPQPDAERQRPPDDERAPPSSADLARLVRRDISHWRMHAPALAVVLTVLAIGAVAGVVAYRNDSARHSHWRIRTSNVGATLLPAVAAGWTVGGSGGPGQAAPALAGDLLVWSSGGQIMRMSVADHTPVPVTATGVRRDDPAVSGANIVWSEVSGVQTSADIYGEDLTTGRVFAICTAPGAQSQPAISGSTVVWTDGRGGRTRIFGKDLATGKEFAVGPVEQGAQDEPAISGHTVVWTDHADNRPASRIVAKDLATGRTFVVSRQPFAQVAPAISGHTVVWQQFTLADGSGSNIYSADLKRGLVASVATGAGVQAAPAIDGDLVVWSDNRGGQGYDVDGCYLPSTEVFQISADNGDELAAAVSGQNVAWTWQSGFDALVEVVRLKN